MSNDAYRRNEIALIVFICFCILTCLFGWQIPLMDIDAQEYANISREMLLHKNFLLIYEQGRDYLDKPPMLFWLSSLSMRFFGINDMAYRLPSFLFSILSIYSIYRFACLYYTRQLALLSALVLASCQATFLINHDVRTDTMLMGWVMLSIWQIACWLKGGLWKNLIIGAIAIAGGMLTKGPIALMVPIFAFSMHFILTRSFHSFFRWEYIAMLVIIGILLLPMSIGLYRQFDLHPEKIMYGRKGTSGLRFFYWTQSFGRITGESTWHENDHFLFLFENLLWGFLPWTVFFMFGLITGFSEWLRKKFVIGKNEEAISLGGFLVAYCALGSSKAQLPHYIYVVLPLAALITAKFMDRIFFEEKEKRKLKIFSWIHYPVFALLVIALFILLFLPFRPAEPIVIISALLMTAVMLYILIHQWIPMPGLLTAGVFTILLINIFIDTGFYPRLLQYQMSIAVNHFIRGKNIDKSKVFLYQMEPSNSLDFYGNHSFKIIQQPDSLQAHNYLLTGKKGMGMINQRNFNMMDSEITFHVSTLTIPLLNPATRERNSDIYYVLERR